MSINKTLEFNQEDLEMRDLKRQLTMIYFDEPDLVKYLVKIIMEMT